MGTEWGIYRYDGRRGLRHIGKDTGSVELYKDPKKLKV